MPDGVEILTAIRSSLPRGFPPCDMDDVIQEIAILVLSGRVRMDHIKVDIHTYLPGLKKQYKSLSWDISLDQPLTEDTTTTLAEVVIPSPTQSKHRCPNCRKKVKPGNTYCRSGCALAYAAKRRRVIDPIELEDLHLRRWLTNKQVAQMLGVKEVSVERAVSRAGLGRKTPATCKIPDCGKPTRFFKNSAGNLVGNLCDRHLREERNSRMRRNRIKHRPLLTAEQRSAKSQRASEARWDKADQESRLQQNRVLIEGRRLQVEKLRRQQDITDAEMNAVSYARAVELTGLSMRTLMRRVADGKLTVIKAPMCSITIESLESLSGGCK